MSTRSKGRIPLPRSGEYRKNAMDYIGKTIENALTSPTSSMGPTSAFAHAWEKSQDKGYKFDDRKYPLNAAMILSGHATQQVPRIKVEFFSAEPGDRTDVPVHTIGTDFNTPSSFDIEGDSSTALHLDGGNAKIPNSGHIHVQIQTQLRDSEQKISHRFSHYYDIGCQKSFERSLALPASSIGDEYATDTTTDSIGSGYYDNPDFYYSNPLHSSDYHEKHERYHLPHSMLQFNARKSVGGTYQLKNLVLRCNYLGGDSTPLGMYPTDARPEREEYQNVLGPILRPSYFDGSKGVIQARPGYGSSIYDDGVSSLNFQGNVPAQFPVRTTAGGSDQFSSSMNNWLQNNFGNDYPEKMSIIISKPERSGGILSGAGVPDSGKVSFQVSKDREYNIGDVTKVLTAMTLMRLVSEKGINWNRVKNEPGLVHEILANSELSAALKRVYANPENIDNGNIPLYTSAVTGKGEGPTLFQLLTEVSGLQSTLSVDPTELLSVYDDLPTRNFKDTEVEFAQVLGGQRPVFQPGSVVHPSQTGYALIGSCISRIATNQPNSFEPAIIATTQRLDMGGCRFPKNDLIDQQSGLYRSQGVFNAASGMIATPTDLDKLLRAMWKDTEVVPGMKSTIIPQFQFSDQSPASNAMGSWTVCPVICKKRKVIKYTTIDSCGYTLNGHGTRIVMIPEYGLCLTMCLRNVTAAVFQRQCTKIVKTVVKTYKTCYLQPEIRRSQILPCVPVRHAQYCQLPPLYWHTRRSSTHDCHKRVSCKCRKNLCYKRSIAVSPAYYSNPCGTIATDYYTGEQQKSPTEILDFLYKSRMELSPLLDASKITNSVYVWKNEDTATYYVEFSKTLVSIPSDPITQCSTGTTKESRHPCEDSIILELVRDSYSDRYRILIDKIPREYVLLHQSVSPKGNPILGVSLMGYCYFTKEYVQSRVSQLRAVIIKEKDQISSDVYRTLNAGSAEQEVAKKFIGASFLGGLALGGAVGLGLGGLAAGAAIAGGGYPYSGYGYYGGSPVWSPAIVPYSSYGPYYGTGYYPSFRGGRRFYPRNYIGGHRNWRGRRIRSSIYDMAALE